MSGGLAELFVTIGADTRGLTSGLRSANQEVDQTAQQWQRVGAATEQVGQTMTRAVTLPVIAAGAAATKLAVDFDTSMSRMQGLAGVTADEVAGMRDRIMELSHETAIGPQKLADAMYFIASSGIKGAAALDALEVSAKASAAGLGDVEVVADAVTSAMNAYADSGLTAANATDVLVGMVREGKGEADEMAGQLGRILPFASQLGVSFEDLGAGLAYLTRTSGDSRLATTQLGGALQHLLVPSAQGRQALDDIGLSAQGVRDMIREKGLLGALVELDDRFGHSEEKWKQLVEEGQSVAGILSLVRNNGEDAAPVFDALGDSAGNLDNAFGRFAESAGFESAQAFADLQVALIELGDELVPVVLGFVKAGVAVASFFRGLPGPVQTGLLVFAAFIAVVGPAISIITSLGVFVGAAQVALSGLWTTVAGMIVPTEALTMANLELAASEGAVAAGGTAAAAGTGAAAAGAGGLGAAAGGAASGLGAIGVVLGLVVADLLLARALFTDIVPPLGEFETGSRAAADGAEELTKALGEGGDVVSALTSMITGAVDSNTELDRALTLSATSASDFADILVNTPVDSYGAAFGEIASAVEAAGGDYDKALGALSNYARLQQDSAKAAINAAKAQGLITDAQAHQAVVAATAGGATNDYLGALGRLPEIAGAASDGLGGMGDAAAAAEQQMNDTKSAIDELFAAALGSEGASIQFQLGLMDLTDAINEGTFSLDLNTRAGLEARQNLIGLANDAKTHASAVYEQTGSIDQANLTLGNHISQMSGVLQATGMSEEAAAQYIATLLGIPPDETTTIHSNADLAEVAMDNLADAVNAIPNDVPINVRLNTGRLYADIAGAAAALRSLRDPESTRMPAGMGAGAGRMAGVLSGLDPGGIDITSTPGSDTDTTTTNNKVVVVRSNRDALGHVPAELAGPAGAFLEGRR